MIQSMEILQLPVMALQERIEHELQENPVLEEREPGTTEEGYPNVPELGDEGRRCPSRPRKPKAVRRRNGVGDRRQERRGGFRPAGKPINDDWSNHFDEDSRARPPHHAVAEAMDKKHDAMANMAERPQSLQDYLSEQLAYADTEVVNVELVRYLISHLDERGYMTTPLEDIRQSFGQDVTSQQVEESLEDLQELEPLGVGARDYKECLLLQVTRETPHRDVVRSLIQNHLEDIQRQSAAGDSEAHRRRHEHDQRSDRSAQISQSEARRPVRVAKRAICGAGYHHREERSGRIRHPQLVDDWTPNIYINRKHFEMRCGDCKNPRRQIARMDASARFNRRNG